MFDGLDTAHYDSDTLNYYMKASSTCLQAGCAYVASLPVERIFQGRSKYFKVFFFFYEKLVPAERNLCIYYVPLSRFTNLLSAF